MELSDGRFVAGMLLLLSLRFTVQWIYTSLVAYLYFLYEDTRRKGILFFLSLAHFSDRGVWGLHRQLTGLVLLDPGGVSGGVNIYLSSLQ